MKFSALLVAAALTLATAAPLRVIVVGKPASTVANIEVFRFGPPAAIASSSSPIAFGQPRPHRGGCGGLRAKMDSVSAKMRETFGFAPLPITMEYAHKDVFGMPIVNTPSGPGRAMPYPYLHHPLRGNDGFAFRLHRALNELGPWEGRAISFVFGCGLGVLLRMFFVLAVLFVRSRRNQSQEQAIRLPEHGEVIFVAPPEYAPVEIIIPVDEKKPVDETKPVDVPLN